jgi:hypothetical protein
LSLLESQKNIFLLQKGSGMLSFEPEEIRDLQYWAMKGRGLSRDDLQSLDDHLCKLLQIENPELIEDPDH